MRTWFLKSWRRELLPATLRSCAARSCDHGVVQPAVTGILLLVLISVCALGHRHCVASVVFFWGRGRQSSSPTYVYVVSCGLNVSSNMDSGISRFFRETKKRWTQVKTRSCVLASFPVFTEWCGLASGFVSWCGNASKHV